MNYNLLLVHLSAMEKLLEDFIDDTEHLSMVSTSWVQYLNQICLNILISLFILQQFFIEPSSQPILPIVII